MSSLKEKKCFPCESGSTEHLLSVDARTNLLSEVSGWKLSEDSLSISKEYTFKDFVKAMAFVDSVADVAEEEGHHPDIFISYNRVVFTLSTHSVGGLTENDFIIASRINNLWII